RPVPAQQKQDASPNNFPAQEHLGNTQFLRNQLMAAAFRVWRKEGGGDVPALASSLHMLEDVVFGLFRLKARH
ncbi:MAG: hypothetical protein ABI705_08505, partial [Aestuariivirga sp.]